MNKVKWEEMLPHEFEAAVLKHPVAYLALGCLERHGEHEAYGNDAIKAYEVCVRAAELSGGVVLPASYWHLGAWQWTHRGKRVGEKRVPWGFFIPDKLFYQMYLHVLRQLDIWGFKVAVVVTGHYGGVEEELRELTEYYMKLSPLRVYAIADWEASFHETGFTGDHAGPGETSQLWYIRPDLVDITRAPEETRVKASRSYGEQLVKLQAANIAETVDELLTRYRRQAEWRPPTLREMDELWERIVKERKRWFMDHFRGLEGSYYADP